MGKTKIIAIVGRSGSGKSTIADMLQKKGIPPVVSYTTRPKRDKYDVHHKFVSDSEYDNIFDKLAETVYGGYRYCGKLEGHHDCYSYVIDEVGLKMLKDNSKLDVYSVLVLSPQEVRQKRTTKERFNRDKDYEYKLNYDHVILNLYGLDELEYQVDCLLKLIR